MKMHHVTIPMVDTPVLAMPNLKAMVPHVIVLITVPQGIVK
jgi:hypothetical protein